MPPHHYFTLNTSARIPAIGLGTYSATAQPGAVRAAVIAALQAGYRHIDTAYSYPYAEVEVGEAIRASGVPRNQLFITTKLFQTFHNPADVPTALSRSLARLGTDYVDLFLMHFPHAYHPSPTFTPIQDPTNPSRILIDRPLSRNYALTWSAMQSLPKYQARAIGVSNFSILKLTRLLSAPTTTIIPAVNQVELHPYLPQNSLLEFCRLRGIHVTAHSPLGGRPAKAVDSSAGLPGAVDDGVVGEIAERLGVSRQCVLLSWAVGRGTSVVPKSFDPGRVKENLKIVELGEDEMGRLDRLVDTVGGGRRVNNHREMIGFDVFDEERDEPVEEED